jgi:hypothetical protein
MIIAYFLTERNQDFKPCSVLSWWLRDPDTLNLDRGIVDIPRNEEGLLFVKGRSGFEAALRLERLRESSL